jgi:AcrR family transcriptional regulator
MTRPADPEKRPGQPGGARDKNRRRRTRQLLEAGVALFLEQGIEGTRIDEITGRAGVAKGSFYRYFKDKRDLVVSLLEPLREGFEASTGACAEALRAAEEEPDLHAAYTTLGRDLGALVVAHPDALRLYLQESHAPARGATKPVRLLSDRVIERATELARYAHDNGLLRPFDPALGALSTVGAGERILAAVLSGNYPGDPTEIPGSVTSLVLDGLRRRQR